MSKESEHTPELSALEAALAALTPAPSSLDRDQLMFRAGQLSARSSRSNDRSRRLFWPLATAAGVLVGAALGLLAAGAKEPRIVERVVEVPAEAVAHQPASEPTDIADSAPPVAVARTLKTLNDLALDSGSSYFALRNRIVTWGADALPSEARMSTEPDSMSLHYFEMRDNLIHPDRPAPKPHDAESTSSRGTST